MSSNAAEGTNIAIGKSNGYGTNLSPKQNRANTKPLGDFVNVIKCEDLQRYMDK